MSKQSDGPAQKLNRVVCQCNMCWVWPELFDGILRKMEVEGVNLLHCECFSKVSIMDRADHAVLIPVPLTVCATLNPIRAVAAVGSRCRSRLPACLWACSCPSASARLGWRCLGGSCTAASSGEGRQLHAAYLATGATFQGALWLRVAVGSLITKQLQVLRPLVCQLLTHTQLHTHFSLDDKALVFGSLALPRHIKQLPNLCRGRYTTLSSL